MITAVGSDVTALRIGDEVIALPQGGLATHVIASAMLTVRKPASLTFAQAAEKVGLDGQRSFAYADQLRKNPKPSVCIRWSRTGAADPLQSLAWPP